jgi:hypothetical protein
MTPVIEWEKTVHAIDRAATLISTETILLLTSWICIFLLLLFGL